MVSAGVLVLNLRLIYSFWLSLTLNAIFSFVVTIFGARRCLSSIFLVFKPVIICPTSLTEHFLFHTSFAAIYLKYVFGTRKIDIMAEAHTLERIFHDGDFVNQRAALVIVDLEILVLSGLLVF
jgi:hypothetical protein